MSRPAVDPAPVVMIHGAFCGGWVFNVFRRPFEAAGHAVTAPDLIGHTVGDRVAGLSMSDYARQVERICTACSAPPILIGHSLGGLAAQMAAIRTPVAALILLAPSAPWGVVGGTMEEAVSAVSLYALGPYWLQAVEPDRSLADRYSLDRLARDDRRVVHGRMVAESGRALFETLNWWLDPAATTLVPAGRIAAPVLGVAGGRDAIHPPATVRQTVARLGGVTQVMPQMSHWLPGEPGWDDVAQLCLTWLAAEARAAA